MSVTNLALDDDDFFFAQINLTQNWKRKSSKVFFLCPSVWILLWIRKMWDTVMFSSQGFVKDDDDDDDDA